jgi:hypothetical protein
MAKYEIASDEGAQRYGLEVGETVELELEDGTERALLAAGWLTESKKPKEANK